MPVRVAGEPWKARRPRAWPVRGPPRCSCCRPGRGRRGARRADRADELRRAPLRRGRRSRAAPRRPATPTSSRRRSARRARRSGSIPDAIGLRVVGELEPFWIPVSNFRVTPVLAVADRLPAVDAATRARSSASSRRRSRRSCPARRSRRSSATSASGGSGTGRTRSRSSATARPSGARRHGSSASSARCSRSRRRLPARPSRRVHTDRRTPRSQEELMPRRLLATILVGMLVAACGSAQPLDGTGDTVDHGSAVHVRADADRRADGRARPPRRRAPSMARRTRWTFPRAGPRSTCQDPPVPPPSTRSSRRTRRWPPRSQAFKALPNVVWRSTCSSATWWSRCRCPTGGLPLDVDRRRASPRSSQAVPGVEDAAEPEDVTLPAGAAIHWHLVHRGQRPRRRHVRGRREHLPRRERDDRGARRVRRGRRRRRAAGAADHQTASLHAVGPSRCRRSSTSPSRSSTRCSTASSPRTRTSSGAHRRGPSSGPTRPSRARSASPPAAARATCRCSWATSGAG